MTPVFTGNVDAGGKLRLDCPIAFKQAVKALADAKVEVIVRRRRKARSDRQNRWWWGTAVEILAEHCGYDRESMHYALVAKCFGTTHDERTGLDVPNARSSKLTTKEFSELMEWVVMFAATELDVKIPLPDDVEEGR